MGFRKIPILTRDRDTQREHRLWPRPTRRASPRQLPAPLPGHGSRRFLPGRGQWDCRRSRLLRTPACRCTGSGGVGSRGLISPAAPSPFLPHLSSDGHYALRCPLQTPEEPLPAALETHVPGGGTEVPRGDQLSGRVQGSAGSWRGRETGCPTLRPGPVVWGAGRTCQGQPGTGLRPQPALPPAQLRLMLASLGWSTLQVSDW